MKDIIHFGILGAGDIAHRFADAVRYVDGAEVVAVASRTPGKAEAFARDCTIPMAYTSYEAMLDDPAVEAVYIATTHNFHAEQILQCLHAGRHVLCEKPMTLHKADAEACFALAAEKNLFLMEAMWSRFIPAVQKAKAWITAGRIGTIQAGSTIIGFHASDDPSGRILNPALAGGALYDIGVYPIQILTYLFGERAEEVLGSCRPHPVTGVDARDTFILRFPSADAAVQCMVTTAPQERIFICGSDGSIELPGVVYSEEVRLYNRNRELTETFREASPNGFIFEVEEVVRCLREGRRTSAIMPPADTIRCAELFEQLLQK